MDENVIPEKDRMCLATALVVLHEVYDLCLRTGATAPALALETVFSFVDEILLVTNTDLGGDSFEEKPLQDNAAFPEAGKGCGVPHGRVI